MLELPSHLTSLPGRSDDVEPPGRRVAQRALGWPVVSEDHDAISTEREWISFEGAGDDGETVTWMFDVTFLASSYECIYGRGCRGIEETDTTALQRGCCTHGAHLTGKADIADLKAATRRLTDDDWQFRALARKAGRGKPHLGILETDEDGDTVTRRHDGACIFLNRPDHPGGAGCALHAAALRHGERPLDWKPDVCWQVPLRLEYLTDTLERDTRTLTDWRRRDWGDGGLAFHWWCTESTEAYVGHEPVWRSLRDEIVELVGEAVYDELARRMIARGETTPTVPPTAGETRTRLEISRRRR